LFDSIFNLALYLFPIGLLFIVIYLIVKLLGLQRSAIEINKNLERKVEERSEELEARELQLRLIIDHVPASISFVDADERYIFVNQQCADFFKKPASDIIGKTLRQNLGEEVYKKAKPKVDAVLNGEEINYEFWWEEEGQERKYIQVSYLPNLDEHGHVIGFFYIVQDHTEHKANAEDLIKAKEEAEAATKAKSAFLANMSHEIRTPMNGVLGMTDLLADTELNEEQKGYIKNISSSGAALLEIINDILDLSKIEADKLELEPINFNLRVTIDEVMSLLWPRAKEQNLELILRYPPDAPEYLIGDPGRIKQVLVNLIGNSIKFTDSGYILLNIIHEKTGPNKNNLRFEIQDTGIGIPEDKQELIFNKFDQADNSSTRKFGGTGLGLAICKRLVNMMGGDIGVDSVFGEGSTFWFFAIFKDGDAPEIKEIAEIDIKDTRVLALDDLEINHKIYHEYLSQAGVHCDSVYSGGEALEALKKAYKDGKPYKVALIDYQLPGMNGIEVAQAIKADDDLKDIIMVMVTASPIRGESAQIKEVGFAGYLVKPLFASLLTDTLKLVLEADAKNADLALVTRHTIAEAHAKEEGTRVVGDKFDNYILVVEDNKVNQMVSRTLLEKLGCTVEIANHGKEAVEMVTRNDYDLIFMDCQMPEMDGYEATQAIRNMPIPKKDSIIVALTAHALQSDKEACLNSGMDDYLLKPVKIEDLEKMLAKHIKD
jgi:PAS domain S-box-containing protein